jgi:hypothetical protein
VALAVDSRAQLQVLRVELECFPEAALTLATVGEVLERVERTFILRTEARYRRRVGALEELERALELSALL